MNRKTTIILLLLFTATSAFSATRTWKTGTIGDWHTAGNWVENIVPAAGDDVFITAAGVTSTLAASSAALNSLTLAGTLVFTNWNTTLNAVDVTIQSGGVMTCAGPFTDVQMSNNVYVVCTDMTIDAGGKIDLNGKGYAGGNNSSSSPAGDGYGPGRGVANAYGVGASHGGRGGAAVNLNPASDYPGAYVYGIRSTPLLPGSGGGGSGTASGGLSYGGAGGGAVRIEATGAVVVNEIITANGVNGAGAGSGGSVYIQCNTFDGTGGRIAANGGTGYHLHGTGGHGGGGRISINYNTLVQATVPGVVLEVKPGSLTASYGGFATRGDIGTIYLPDNRFFTETVSLISGKIWGFNSLSRNSLTVDNVWVRFAEDGFLLTVTNDLIVTGAAGMLQIGGGTVNTAFQYDPRYSTGDRWYGPAESSGVLAPVVAIGGNLTINAGAGLAVFSAATNVAAPEYGALVEVADKMEISGGSGFYPYSHPTNGGSVWLRVTDITVSSDSSINAVGKGFAGSPASATNGFGPGGVANTYYAAGGGYGGAGGSSHSVPIFGGDTYGSATSPRLPGSGGGRVGAAGGGAVIIEALGKVTVAGGIIADGMLAGSGGAIDVTCETFVGTNGLLSATGSNAETHHGAGGGGRIALKYDTNLQSPYALSETYFNASGGAASSERPSADLGTLYFSDTSFLVEILTGVWGKLVGFDAWTVPTLTITNAYVHFVGDGFKLTVDGDLTVGSDGDLRIGGPVDGDDLFCLSWSEPPYRTRHYPHGFALAPELLVGGNLALTNGGVLSVYSAPSEMVGVDETGRGALVNVANDMFIYEQSWLYPYAHPTNGAAPLLRMNNLTIEAGGGIDANARGFAGGIRMGTVAISDGYGPGYSRNSAYPNGAGYGGLGGNNVYNHGHGAVYGDENTPLYPGSSGVNSSGGGLIMLDLSGILDLSGSLTADAHHTGGASSGGGVYIRCKRLSGVNGLITARGGNANSYHSGSGAGGRIAIWRMYESWTGLDVRVDAGAVSYSGGEPPADRQGENGTVVWKWIPIEGTVIKFW